MKTIFKLLPVLIFFISLSTSCSTDDFLEDELLLNEVAMDPPSEEDEDDLEPN